jgi:hypothetical protein
VLSHASKPSGADFTVFIAVTIPAWRSQTERLAGLDFNTSLSHSTTRRVAARGMHHPGHALTRNEQYPVDEVLKWLCFDT